MGSGFDSLADGSDSAESRLIDSAWAQVEAVAARHKPSLSAARDPLAIPSYRLLGEIHRGGQGVVYQAIQESTQRKVAIKVLKGGPFADEAELARFDREVDVLSRLHHPHIVAIHDRGLAAGHAYYVMDYIPGRPLDAHVAGAFLSTPEVLDLVREVCEAVNVAHLRGIIHRDLKPSNIRIDEQGEPHVLDFGLAKFTPAASWSPDEMTVTGQFVGSLPWASPEQAEGRSELLDIRTDVYSLGVILYQLLTGTFPYPVSGRMNEVAHHISYTNPARPSTIVRDLDWDVEVILLKCLAKDPERRYQSAGELARDIQRYLSEEPIEARPASSYYQLRQFARRNKALVTSLVAVIIILASATTVSIVFALREAAARVQTRAVADFQAKMLADIDPQAMGVKLQADLLTKARAASKRDGRNTEEMDERVRELESYLTGVDFTGLALTALDEGVFQRALIAIEKQFADRPLVKAMLLQSLADTLRDVGLLEAAIAPQTVALALRRQELGDDHVDTLTSIARMGLLVRTRGNLAQAEPYYREALEKRRIMLGDEHVDTLSSVQNMGGLLQAQGKLKEAEPFYREAFEKRRRVLGEEHIDTLTSMSGVGYLLTAQGKWGQAAPIYRDVLERRRRVLGDDHPHTLFSMNNMGALLQTQRKFDEAEKLYNEALEKRRRLFGDSHPDTLQSINNLGNLLEAQGKFTEAEPYYSEALEKRRQVLGDEHPNTLNSINNMGALLLNLGRLSEAEPYTREALEKRRRLMGEDHPEITTSIHNMGFLLQSQGKFTEAEPYCRDALGRWRKLLGDDHPDTLIAINNMGLLLLAQGKLSEAAPYCREALEGRRRVRGEEHLDTVVSVTNMGSLLQAQNKPAEAIALMAPLEAAARQVLAGNPVRLARFITPLGCARADTGEFDAAEGNLGEAYAILSKATAATERDRTDVLRCLVELYMAQHAAEPDKGYDAKASEWRLELVRLRAPHDQVETSTGRSPPLGE